MRARSPRPPRPARGATDPARRPCARRNVACCVAAAVAASPHLLPAGQAPAQTSGHGEAAAAAPPPAAPSATPASADRGGFAPPATDRSRVVLLREGSHLVRVLGRIAPGETGESRQFVIDPADDRAPAHALTLMPCTLLGETERMIESAEEHELLFEVTGEVFVYRGRNYLMPTHPPLLVQPEPQPEEMGPPLPSAPEVPAGDTAEDIIRELERDVGPVPRTGAGRRGTRPGRSASAAPDERLAAEGTMIVERRGTIRRTGGGAFVFVLDADATGLADPPLTLLPCLMLERLEDLSQQTGARTPVLLTGQAYVYHGQNYLLPTVFRVPYERTRLAP